VKSNTTRGLPPGAHTRVLSQKFAGIRRPLHPAWLRCSSLK
jgi:hypothetical protein